METISELVDNISTELKSLSTLLYQHPVRYACVASIPPTLKGQENDPIKHIEINENYGHDAVELALQSYRDLYIKPELSQKSTRRTVGMLWLPVSQRAEEIEATVERINAAKTHIEEFITSNYSTQNERFDAVHSECPGIMTLHLYRHVRC